MGIYVWISFHTAEGCCCLKKNTGASDCNFFGCNCEELHKGYCIRCKGNRVMDGTFWSHSGNCWAFADYDDYCPDKRKKRSISKVEHTYKEVFPDYESINVWEEFSTMDSNQDGVVLFEEALAFKNITKMENGNPDFDWAKRQWALMDNNQDGYVTPKEMQTYIG